MNDKIRVDADPMSVVIVRGDVELHPESVGMFQDPWTTNTVYRVEYSRRLTAEGQKRGDLNLAVIEAVQAQKDRYREWSQAVDRAAAARHALQEFEAEHGPGRPPVDTSD